jgi:hypothetical protein
LLQNVHLQAHVAANCSANRENDYDSIKNKICNIPKRAKHNIWKSMRDRTASCVVLALRGRVA